MSAPSILLMGSPGSGKTHSIRTLVDNNITPFILFTEAGQDILEDIPTSKCHWAKVSPTTGSWDAMTRKAETVTRTPWDALVKQIDPMKKDYNSYTNLLHLCQNFKCARTNEEFGDVTTWGEDRALVLDSLTGLNTMILQAVVGGQVTVSQPQWGAAMGMEMQLIMKLCNDTNCWFILTAHLDKIIDEVMGGQIIMPSALGRKNGPQLPSHFSDVILAEKDGAKWVWRTVSGKVDLKARNLPYAERLEPDFGQIIKTLNARKEKASEKVSS